MLCRRLPSRQTVRELHALGISPARRFGNLRYSRLGSLRYIMTPGSPNESPDIVGLAPAPEPPTTFEPYIPASVQLPELRLLPILIGSVLGMVFGASSLYLVLK